MTLNGNPRCGHILWDREAYTEWQPNQVSGRGEAVLESKRGWACKKEKKKTPHMNHAKMVLVRR